MEQYKERFIEFMVRSNVLTFGDFTTKSGRKTPFFVNTGKYRTGQQIEALGLFYAKTILNSGADFNVLFGPAYKGIPLVVSTAIALRNMNIPYFFNRKETKDHGEGGNFIGHKPQAGDRILIVEDVITAGTTIRESMDLFKAIEGVCVAGVIVSVDRMERGSGDISAIAEIVEEFGFPVFPIVNINEIVEYLHYREVDGKVVIDDKTKTAIYNYRAQYGAK